VLNVIDGVGKRSLRRSVTLTTRSLIACETKPL
jgi:hypothetical protein